MSKKIALYGRACTEKQDLNNQKEKLLMWAQMKGYDYDLYSEKVESINERPQFEEIMDKLDKYELVVVPSLDKFGKSVTDVFESIKEMKQNGSDFISIEEPINTNDGENGEYFLNVLSTLADFKEKITRRRMEKGYTEAKEEGRVGRPKKAINEEDLKRMYKEGASYQYLAEYFDCSKSTIRNRLESLDLIGDR